MDLMRLFGSMAKHGRALLSGVIVVVVFSANAHADQKCEAALENLHQKFYHFMLENRDYAKLLSSAAKEMKKSAKRVKGDSGLIQRYINDRDMSKKEAKKINKMFQKAELINQKLIEIKNGGETLKAKLDDAFTALNKAGDKCDAE